MFALPGSWVWDFWFADDGEKHHLFFLQASRALRDPDRRHQRATVGHAVSEDLHTWHQVADALVSADEPAWDDRATWTGSIVRDDDGLWRMFYTGVDRAGGGLVQRIGGATSTDLVTWERVGKGPLTEPVGRWYDLLDLAVWPDQAWRDPWVFADPRGDGWHMLVTARADHPDPWQRGVVGHATSADLTHWSVGPPLSRPGSGFGQLEVLSLVEVEGRWTLVFSCMTGELGTDRRARGEVGGIWAVDVDDPGGPFDIAGAYLLLDESLYVGRLVQDRSGAWQLMAFHNMSADGFVGAISDPMPVRRDSGGRLRVE